MLQFVARAPLARAPGAMKVTLLGHASLLVEVGGRTVLVDPVFGDPFGEGMLVSCPRRRVHVDRLPAIDLLVVTSAAPDHFDPESIARLSREVPVICVDDALVVRAFELLGFRHVRVHAENRIARIGAFELFTTGSTRNVDELGVALRDESGVMWTTVDTTPSPEVIDAVRARFRRIDLFLAAYAPQALDYHGSARAGFPAASLRASLAVAARVGARLTVPWSNGFRFAPPFEWTNALVFPVARERFVSELARVRADLRTALGNPGDVFVVEPGGVERRPASADCAEMIEDDTSRVAYDLTAPVPPLTDPNLDDLPRGTLEREVDRCLTGLAAFVRASSAGGDAILDEHRRRGVVYGIEIVFPDGRRRWMRVRWGATPIIELGEGEIRDVESLHRIAASVVAGWCRDERRWFHLGGLSRRSMALGATLVDGNVAIDPRELLDPLVYYVAARRPGAETSAITRLQRRLQPLIAPA